LNCHSEALLSTSNKRLEERLATLLRQRTNGSNKDELTQFEYNITLSYPAFLQKYDAQFE
jgi:hypothetical protein